MSSEVRHLVHLDPLPLEDYTSAEYRRTLELYFETHLVGGVRVQFSAPASRDRSELEALARRAHYWLVTKVAVPNSLIDAAPHLTYIHKIGITLDRVDIEAATARGILVSVSPHAGAAAVAEHTLLLMLALGKDLVQLHHRTASAANPQQLMPFHTSEQHRYYNYLGLSGDHFTQLQERTLGILGLGEIGTEVAQRALAFRMRVVYCKKRRLSEESEARMGVEFAGLENLLRGSDFVSIHVPQTSETERMIGTSELRMMRPTAYLINTARGNIVDESALVDALQDGWIAGAGLDVFDVEPPQPENPLLRLPNVILSPHIAARGPVITRYTKFLANLEAFIEGRPLEGVVNPAVLR